MTADAEARLASVTEAVLEPDRPIVDSHHHVWDDETLGFEPYPLDAFLADVGSGHRIERTVFVQCDTAYRKTGPAHLRPVGETEFVAKLSAKTETGHGPLIAGIVGFADLTLGAAVDEVLDAHGAAAPKLFRGIRQYCAFDDAMPKRLEGPRRPGLYYEAAFREGFARLAKHGLIFDAFHYHHQIPDTAALARAFPDQPIVLDHFGGVLGVGPYEGKEAEIFPRWKADIADLARCPNAYAKLGGLAMRICPPKWHERDTPATSDEYVQVLRPYYLHVIDRFGPERCMFESNFPPDRLSISYPVLWNAFKKIAAGFSESEKDALFRGTATKIYRLADMQ